MLLITIFCHIDDFCKDFENQFKRNLLTDGSNKRNRSFKLSLSEIMTIMIFYHQSGYKTFKDYYEKEVLGHMKTDFNGLVSYNRFLELRQKAFLPLLIYSQLASLGRPTGISFIDSFSLAVCHNRRISSNKVFKGIAQRGKTSVGWFYGFKVHLIINHLGEIISFYITPGNVADSNESVLIKLTKDLFGKIFGDRGYLVGNKLFQQLYKNGIHLITKIRKNMKSKLMPLEDKLLLKKRGLVETVGGVLKEGLSMEHSRHRSPLGFFGYIVSTLIAYGFRKNKPSIKGSKLQELVVA